MKEGNPHKEEENEQKDNVIYWEDEMQLKIRSFVIWFLYM